ncbi:DUF3043 domain-containing protein [Brevibacterium sp. 50QC2O2]|jgi:hypothetical protein|uniref:DUF3043 domain-containing protein n=1 Tax=Brevibacterium TaxID=1696 RepID=UPI00211B7E48|nr:MULTISPECIES: DUF3043 domain-containing protein [unclassified Brevibacterium]MCQ9384342.1 DUF3043 domain-containing protein [Brevibacterium sp. 68QC2CO]MCQ9388961.1 DUF3043 domain-containing protein [Brevibacterium sp. 50QC2O2]
MGIVFGRNKKSQDEVPGVTAGPAATPAQDAPQGNPAEQKKNRPTPKRSQQQAANRRPLVPEDRKAADKASKEEMRKQREDARLGLMNGDERYLTARDAGPQRRYVRDFIDARYSIGELLIPVAVVVLIIGFLTNQTVQVYATIVVYALFALLILDSFVLNYQLKGRMAVKFGGKDKIQRGTTWYAVMRAIQLRPLRMPKPQVKRRQYPE